MELMIIVQLYRDSQMGAKDVFTYHRPLGIWFLGACGTTMFGLTTIEAQLLLETLLAFLGRHLGEIELHRFSPSIPHGKWTLPETWQMSMPGPQFAVVVASNQLVVVMICDKRMYI
ncbi:uncharacterized [Tachysurus ichikawai]